jgi:hypothetical protein
MKKVGIQITNPSPEFVNDVQALQGHRGQVGQGCHCKGVDGAKVLAEFRED